MLTKRIFNKSVELQAKEARKWRSRITAGVQMSLDCILIAVIYTEIERQIVVFIIDKVTEKGEGGRSSDNKKPFSPPFALFVLSEYLMGKRRVLVKFCL